MYIFYVNKIYMECPVCFENKTLCKLSCTHHICNKCLSEWLNINNNCPLCRNKISKICKKNYPYISYNNTAKKILVLIYPNNMWIFGTIHSINSSHIILNDCSMIHILDKHTSCTKSEIIDFSIIEKLFYI